MTPGRTEEIGWRLVATWKDVEMAKLNRPESRYTPGVCEELFLDALAILKRFNPADIEDDADQSRVRVQDVGLAIRNAGDTVLRAGNTYACITRIDIEQELHVIASARLTTAQSRLLLGSSKAQPIDRVSGADFVDSEFPKEWSNWRKNGSDDLIFPPLWAWDESYPTEKQAMPVIRARLEVLMRSDEHKHHIENARRYVISLFNSFLRIAVESAKVPPVYMGGLGARSNWDDAMLSELSSKIERYNHNRIEKIKFDVKANILRAKAQCACYYYGLLTLEQK